MEFRGYLEGAQGGKHTSLSEGTAQILAIQVGLTDSDQLQIPAYQPELSPNAYLICIESPSEYIRFDAEANTLGWSRLKKFNTSESVKTREAGFAMLNTIDTEVYDVMLVQEPNLKHYLIYTKPKTSSSDLEDAQ